MWNKLTNNIMVEDVKQSIEFYADILGFELVMKVPANGNLSWAHMKKGGVELMFQARHSISEEVPEFKDKDIGGTLTLYIEVTDIQTLYSELKNKVPVVQEMHRTDYNKDEFAITDCNGYILAFAADITK